MCGFVRVVFWEDKSVFAIVYKYDQYTNPLITLTCLNINLEIATNMLSVFSNI